METLDFSKLTAEELLDRIPEEEDRRWEFKAGEFLSKDKRSEFRTELGKQVSAFANSGGGYFVVGISKEGQLAPTDQLKEGGQSMTDWLAQRTEQSVDPWIRDFHVHKLPLATDETKAVYIIEIGDSVSAPHQAKDDLTYYYRIPGHSKRAPHFHLELLRNRTTKAMLKVADIRYQLERPTTDGGLMILVKFAVTIENVSHQAATHWGLVVSDPSPVPSGWTLGKSVVMKQGYCIHGRDNPLLPFDRSKVEFNLHYNYGRYLNPSLSLQEAWRKLGLVLLPVSHNAAGEPYRYGFWGDDTELWGNAQAAMADVARYAPGYS